MEVDEELARFREIVVESEGFTWGALLDEEEEDGGSQDEIIIVD